MTILRCSQKLLNRLRLDPRKLPEPPPGDNPLGEWCADIDFIARAPCVLLMNAATGLVLVLPGRAAELKLLHEMASAQLQAILGIHAIRGPLAEAELTALHTSFAFARNSNRSLVASMNRRKFDAWVHLADGESAFDVALRIVDTPFSRKDLPGRTGRHGDFHYAMELLRQRLLPSANILPFAAPTSRN